MKMQDTFQSGLGNGKNFAAVDMFAQQHAEVRRVQPDWPAYHLSDKSVAEQALAEISSL